MKKGSETAPASRGFNLNSILSMLVGLVSVFGTIVSVGAVVLGMFISVGAGFMWAGTISTRLDAQREVNAATQSALTEVRKAQTDLARDLDAWEKYQLSERADIMVALKGAAKLPQPPGRRREEPQ